MRFYAHSLFALMVLSSTWTLPLLAPTVTRAEAQLHEPPDGKSVSHGHDEASGQAEPDSIKQRGIQRLGPTAAERLMAPPGTMAPPVVDSGFKCSPNTERCRCSGAADCTYMKDLIGGSCPTFTCTGTGANQKCCCVLGRGTCQP